LLKNNIQRKILKDIISIYLRAAEKYFLIFEVNIPVFDSFQGLEGMDISYQIINKNMPFFFCSWAKNEEVVRFCEVVLVTPALLGLHEDVVG
jgi:hypothetical protein